MDIVRRGPLNWAQHILWFYNEPTFFREWGAEPHIARDLELPPNLTADRLAAALAECAERFEALRTVYSPRAEGTPEQRVLASYQPPLMDMDSGEPPRFDICERPGFHCLVRLNGEAVLEARISANRIDMDGQSIAALATMLERRLATGRSWDLLAPPRPCHPLDIAAQQQSPAYARRSARGIAWFQEVRRGFPRNVLPARRDDAGGMQVTTLAEPDLLSLAERLARVCGATPASVFHTVIGVAMAAWTGERRIALTTATANRWQGGAATAIGRLASEIDCVIEVDPAQSAAELVRRVHGDLFHGYRNAVRDFGSCTMEAIRDNVRAGSDLAKTLFVEYLHFPLADLPAREAPQVRSIRTEHRPGGAAQILFNLLPMPPGMGIELVTDSAILGPRDAQRIVNLVANLLRRCVDAPDAPMEALTRLIEPAAYPEAEWIDVGGSRFDTARIRRCLAGFAGVREAAALPGTGGGLEVFVRGEGIDLEALHEHMLRQVSTDPLTCLPAAYTLVASAPPIEGGAEGWRSAKADARFRPRSDYRPSVADDERIGALAEVFASCHPGARIDPARSYAELGGEYLQIPAMVARLDRAGLKGAHPNNFLSLLSLAALARGLRRGQ